MKPVSLPFALVVLTSGLALAQGRPQADVNTLVESQGVHSGSVVRVALQVSLPAGLHVQSDKPRDPMLIPTVLTIEPPAGVTVSEIAYPAATDFAQAGQKVPLAVFEQRFVVGAKLALDRTLATGHVIVPGRLRYQACDASTCFAPVRAQISWSLNVVAAATTTAPRFSDVFDSIRFRR